MISLANREFGEVKSRGNNMLFADRDDGDHLQQTCYSKVQELSSVDAQVLRLYSVHGSLLVPQVAN